MATKQTPKKDEAEHTPIRSFYREYRPQKFEDVIGQDQVITVLQAAIKNNSIVHAYIFAGTRGTGKTTVARLFARALDTAEEDIYEIDAASNNSVEDMRSLTESITTLPFRSRFKVYILDEVHMFSKSAFNAFLKTLEEPPAHVLFILATTETDKIPETVVSRCQVFQFQTPSTEILEKVVEKTAKAEKIKLEDGVSELIALSGDGSFRDTLGALQKVVTIAAAETITRAEAELVLGAPKHELVKSYLESYISGNIKEGIDTLSKVKLSGVSMVLFSKLTLRLARLLFHVAYGVHDMKGNETELSWLKKTVEAHKAELNLHMLTALIDADREVRFAFMPELPFEVALLKASKIK